MKTRSYLIMCCLGVFAFLTASLRVYSDETTIYPFKPNGQDTLIRTTSPVPTKYYEDGGPFITLPLMCPKDILLKAGLSWRGITIGKSRLQELEELYGVIATKVQSDYAGSFVDIYEITLTGNASMERRLAVSVEACVVDGKIAALAITPLNDSELSDVIESWVVRFGSPEIIAWSVGGSWRYRDLVWPEVGLALHVDLGDASLRMAYISTLVFFPPTQNTTDLSKWPYSQLQKDSPIAPNEGYPKELNPFDFASMLANATGQPSTPISTPIE